MQNLNQSILRNLAIALPPIAEQRRIVAQVDGLMTLCARLTTELASVATLSERLLEAVLHQALDSSRHASGLQLAKS
ncbi:MAG: hypothetical protein H0W53_02235 [Acidobacteria bacterium]|nr:hypothetical protein [Acidobacteriota bacterium]